MSNSQYRDPQVIIENEFLKVFKELIPVRCSVKDCNQNQEIFSIPVQLDDLNPSKKAIIFVCPEHHQKQNETRIRYSFLQNQIVKQLRIVKFENRDLQLYKANQKLQQNACCMRENAKTANLEIILTKLQMLSQDDNIIFQLVKRLYTQQYFKYLELKQKIKQGSNNPLATLHLKHLLDQLKAQQLQKLGSLIDSLLILQPNNREQYQPPFGQSSVVSCYQSKD